MFASVHRSQLLLHLKNFFHQSFFARSIIFFELSIPTAFFTLNSCLAIERLVPSPHPK